jgi:hypothetical protein
MVPAGSVDRLVCRVAQPLVVECRQSNDEEGLQWGTCVWARKSVPRCRRAMSETEKDMWSTRAGPAPPLALAGS